MSMKEMTEAIHKVNKDDDDTEAEFLDRYQDKFGGMIKQLRW